MATSGRWLTDAVSPLELRLDPDNPRFELVTRSQDEILIHLLRDHDLLTLARSIADAKQLWPTETILAAFDGKQYTVLEGNRRTAACKLLLNPEMLPDSVADLRSHIPVIDEEARENLTKVQICYDYDRRRGDPIVANIHAMDQRRSWSLPARMRYVHREFKMGLNPEEIASTLRIDLKTVRQLLRGREALHLAIHGSKWSAREKAILYNDDEIDHEPFLKAVLSPSVERHFGQPMFFDNGQPNRNGFPTLDAVVGMIARHTLISQRFETEYRFGKGDSIEEYLRKAWRIGKRVADASPTARDLFDLNKPVGEPSFLERPSPSSSKEGQSQAFKGDQEAGRVRAETVPDFTPSIAEPPNTETDDGAADPASHVHGGVGSAPVQALSNQTAQKPSQKPKPVLLLEDIRCLRDDFRLEQLTYELAQLGASKANLTNFRFSCFMLMRALLEWALVYHFDQKGITCRDSDGQHFGIGKLVQMANSRPDAFPENKKLSQRAGTIASHWIHDLNWNSHNDMGNWSLDRLQAIAGDLRPILQHILMDATY